MENMYGTDAVQMLIQANDRMAKDISKVSEKIDKMTDMMAQLAVMSERQDNHEKHTRDSNNRVHKRIDEVVIEMSKKHLDSVDRIKVIEVKCENHILASSEHQLKDASAHKELQARCGEVEKQIEKLDFMLVLFRYPYLMLGIFVGLYIFAIKDIRDIIFQFLGVM